MFLLAKRTHICTRGRDFGESGDGGRYHAANDWHFSKEGPPLSLAYQKYVMLHSVPGAGGHKAHQLRGATPGALLSPSPHPHPTRTEPRAGRPCRATSRPQVVLRRRVCFHHSRRQFLSVAPEKGWSPLFLAQRFLGKWCQRVKARPTATDNGFNQNPASQALPRLPARASAGHQTLRLPLPSEPGSMPSCS